jgi:hypothetical protein
MTIISGLPKHTLTGKLYHGSLLLRRRKPLSVSLGRSLKGTEVDVIPKIVAMAQHVLDQAVRFRLLAG